MIPECWWCFILLAIGLLNARRLMIVIPGLYYGGFDIEGSSINDLYSSSMTCNIGCTILYGGYFNTSSMVS